MKLIGEESNICDLKELRRTLKSFQLQSQDTKFAVDNKLNSCVKDDRDLNSKIDDIKIPECSLKNCEELEKNFIRNKNTFKDNIGKTENIKINNINEEIFLGHYYSIDSLKFENENFKNSRSQKKFSKSILLSTSSNFLEELKNNSIPDFPNVYGVFIRFVNEYNFNKMDKKNADKKESKASKNDIIDNPSEGLNIDKNDKIILLKTGNFNYFKASENQEEKKRIENDSEINILNGLENNRRNSEYIQKQLNNNIEKNASIDNEFHNSKEDLSVQFSNRLNNNYNSIMDDYYNNSNLNNSNYLNKGDEVIEYKEDILQSSPSKNRSLKRKNEKKYNCFNCRNSKTRKSFINIIDKKIDKLSMQTAKIIEKDNVNDFSKNNKNNTEIFDDFKFNKSMKNNFNNTNSENSKLNLIFNPKKELHFKNLNSIDLLNNKDDGNLIIKNLMKNGLTFFKNKNKSEGFYNEGTINQSNNTGERFYIIILFREIDKDFLNKISQTNKNNDKKLSKLIHELKTPLNSIIGITADMIENYTETNQIDNLNVLRDLSIYSTFLINDITQGLNKNLTSLYGVDIQNLHLRNILEFSYNILKALLKCFDSKADLIDPILEISDKVDLFSYTSDEIRLKQIILNLISNSVKFTKRGFIKIQAEIISKEKYMSDFDQYPEKKIYSNNKEESNILEVNSVQNIISNYNNYNNKDSNLKNVINEPSIVYKIWHNNHLNSSGLKINNISLENEIIINSPSKLNRNPYQEPSSKINFSISKNSNILEKSSNLSNFNILNNDELEFISKKENLNSNNYILLISVIDSGIGIETKNQNKIFSEYKKFLNIKDSDNKFGSGMGLNIVNKLANIMEHKMGFISNYGEGSSFKIYIKCKPKINNINNTIISLKKNFSKNYLNKINETIISKNTYSNYFSIGSNIAHKEEDNNFKYKSKTHNSSTNQIKYCSSNSNNNNSSNFNPVLINNSSFEKHSEKDFNGLGHSPKKLRNLQEPNSLSYNNLIKRKSYSQNKLITFITRNQKLLNEKEKIDFDNLNISNEKNIIMTSDPNLNQEILKQNNLPQKRNFTSSKNLIRRCLIYNDDVFSSILPFNEKSLLETSDSNIFSMSQIETKRNLNPLIINRRYYPEINSLLKNNRRSDSLSSRLKETVRRNSKEKIEFMYSFGSLIRNESDLLEKDIINRLFSVRHIAQINSNNEINNKFYDSNFNRKNSISIINNPISNIKKIGKNSVNSPKNNLYNDCMTSINNINIIPNQNINVYVNNNNINDSSIQIDEIPKPQKIETCLKNNYGGLNKSPLSYRRNSYSCNNKLKILIVDDQKFARNSIKNVVMKVLKANNLNNYEIIEGTDGIDILMNVIEDNRNYNLIKLIITDENMEFINGSYALEILKNLQKMKRILNSYKICFLSSNDEETKKKFFYQKGADYVLNKPCDFEDISYVINLIDKKK